MFNLFSLSLTQICFCTLRLVSTYLGVAVVRSKYRGSKDKKVWNSFKIEIALKNIQVSEC